MKKKLPEPLLFEGVTVDIFFSEPLPMFGDLFLIAGFPHPHFPPTGKCAFEKFVDLQFQQVDDYFGVRSLTEEGDDVIVWLYPLVGGQPVHHHVGPFEGIRLTYCVLCNPIRRVEHFLRCVQEFGSIGARVDYQTRGMSLGPPLDIAPLAADIDAVVQHWIKRGIVVGSDKALHIDF